VPTAATGQSSSSGTPGDGSKQVAKDIGPEVVLSGSVHSWRRARAHPEAKAYRVPAWACLNLSASNPPQRLTGASAIARNRERGFVRLKARIKSMLRSNRDRLPE